MPPSSDMTKAKETAVVSPHAPTPQVQQYRFLFMLLLAYLTVLPIGGGEQRRLLHLRVRGHHDIPRLAYCLHS